MATAIDLAGVDYPATRGGHEIIPLEGISLRPAFIDLPLKRKALFWEHIGPRAIRMGDWKLVGTNDTWKLFDLAADPTELNNLADAHPERVEAMSAAWQAWAERSLVK